MLTDFSTRLDDEDAATVNRAIAVYQREIRWERMSPPGTICKCGCGQEMSGVYLPAGGSDVAGAVLAQICRAWLASMEESMEEEGE
jgi:hypothetical protein